MVALPVDLGETDGLRSYSFIHQPGSWHATDVTLKGWWFNEKIIDKDTGRVKSNTDLGDETG